MKFYQAIASMIFCVMYSTTIFGSTRLASYNCLDNVKNKNKKFKFSS